MKLSSIHEQLAIETKQHLENKKKVWEIKNKIIIEVLEYKVEELGNYNKNDKRMENKKN
jgi:hypothetical protein